MNLILISVIALGALAVVLRWQTSFAAQSPGDYEATGPQIDIRSHLAGKMKCEGVIYGPTGRVNSRFSADMIGNWNGSSGEMRESFFYVDGGTQDRMWSMQLGNDGRFTATAPDVIGTAQGEQSGATVRMKYRLRLPKDAGGHVLNVTDWLYLGDGGVLTNRSEMRKFGIKVAELVATIRPA